MKILLAGASGNLGKELFKQLSEQGYNLIAADLNIDKLPKPKESSRVELRKIDVTKPNQITGICNEVDIVITTIGLTSYRTHLTNMDVDYQGNLNLLREALQSGVKKFVYVSVFGADTDLSVPMLNAKLQFERELKSSPISWIIVRPTGYYTDFSMLFLKMARKGKISLIGNNPALINPIHPADVAEWIVNNLDLENQTVEIGGPDRLTYRDIALTCFELLGKKPKISTVPVVFFRIMAWLCKPFSFNKYCILQFSRWALTTNFSAPPVGRNRIYEYLKSCLPENRDEDKPIA